LVRKFLQRPSKIEVLGYGRTKTYLLKGEEVGGSILTAQKIHFVEVCKMVEEHYFNMASHDRMVGGIK
jgi:hypothetical protein